MITDGMDEVGDAETTSVERWSNDLGKTLDTGILAAGRSFPVEKKSVLLLVIGSFGATSANGTGV